MPELEAQGLVHVYPSGVRALDGVDLSITPGSRLAIVGQNGSGKSTLIRHFNGLLRPTAGRVLLDGADARRLRVAQLAAHVGIAFQDPDRQLFAASVLDEVRFGPRNLGMSETTVRQAAGEALELTGLTADASRNPYDLGRARRKLLSVASVLAMRTAVLILDEPTTGQDAVGTERIKSVIASCAASGRTVVAVTHDMELVAEAFERVVVMRAGRVILDASTAEAFAEDNRGTLRSTNLEPPLAARAAAALQIAGAVTVADVVAELVRRGGATQ